MLNDFRVLRLQVQGPFPSNLLFVMLPRALATMGIVKFIDELINFGVGRRNWGIPGEYQPLLLIRAISHEFVSCCLLLTAWERAEAFCWLLSTHCNHLELTVVSKSMHMYSGHTVLVTNVLQNAYLFQLASAIQLVTPAVYTL